MFASLEQQAVNDTSITSGDDLVAVIRDCQAGDELTVTLYRQGEALELTITVGQQIQPAIAQSEGEAVQQSQSQQNFDPWSFFQGNW